MKMIIGGEWVEKKEKIDVINPYAGKVIDTVPRGTAEYVDRAVAAAVEGDEDNRHLPLHKRT